MTTLDLDALERAARAATPGEWTAWKAPTGEWTVRAQYRDDQDRRCTTWPAVCNAGAQDNEATAHFLAATQPAAILSLISELRALRKPDTYWSYEDPECGWDSFEEPLSEAGFGKIVVRLLTGKTLGEVWAANRVLTVDDEGDPDETEAVCFDNPHAAERCWEESLRAARTKAGEPHAEG